MTGRPGQRRFVLHDHRKPRPHFDLRLEEDGVLRSWAVPRGLPDDPGENRLAVAVADHDVDHLDLRPTPTSRSPTTAPGRSTTATNGGCSSPCTVSAGRGATR